jgi:uncharacterized protein (DUF433 family)
MVPTEPRSHKSFRWIVEDPEYLNGKLAVRGTRLPVTLILQCLGEGMTLDEIGQTYTPIPPEAIQEIMLIAAEAIAQQHVAA